MSEKYYTNFVPEPLWHKLLEKGMPISRMTYAEVFDWLLEKGIYITFDAFFTFALADNVGYLWKVSYIDKSNGDIKLVTISEEDAWDGKKGYGGSFELDANAAIRYAMNLKNNI